MYQIVVAQISLKGCGCCNVDRKTDAILLTNSEIRHQAWSTTFSCQSMPLSGNMLYSYIDWDELCQLKLEEDELFHAKIDLIFLHRKIRCRLSETLLIPGGHSFGVPRCAHCYLVSLMDPIADE